MGSPKVSLPTLMTLTRQYGNQFLPLHKILGPLKGQFIRAYCPNIYTVIQGLDTPTLPNRIEQSNDDSATGRG